MSGREDAADIKEQIAKLKAHLASRARGVHFGLYKATMKACLLVERTAKQKMTDTNVFLSYTSGKTGKLVKVASKGRSAPGNPPAVDTGALRNSVTHVIEGGESKPQGFVGSVIKDPPYGAYLEHGTAKMAARPWLGVSVDENRAEINEIFHAEVRGGLQGKESSGATD